MKDFATVQVRILVGLALIGSAWSNGKLMKPVGRSSRWRVDSSAPKNHDDNLLYCGGMGTQIKNEGKCGLCGDSFDISPPRPNELGGKYGGTGVIVETYEGNTAEVEFSIDVNRLGYVYFELCNLDEFGTESEECFTKYRLENASGGDKFDVGAQKGTITATVNLPSGVKCAHCVLRWTYFGGDNWNKCPEGGEKLGCGNQDTFKSCADISIA